MQVASARRIAASLPVARRLLAMPLYQNAIYLWGNMLVVALAGLLFWALSAALYSPAEVGLAAAAISALTLLAMISTLGLGMGLVAYLPGSKGEAPILINSAVVAGGACGRPLAPLLFP